jgi:RHS repeat-associated protein
VSYTYDALYRLTSETIIGSSDSTKNGSVGYQYDPVGNRLQRTSTLAAVPPASYSFDANDRLMSDTYDLNGSTVASGGDTYAYDFENRLTSSNGGSVTIVYDGDGNRVAKTASGVTTQYLVDDRNLTGYVLEELSGGAVQRVYTYGLNRISQSQASGTSFYGYDGHGSVRLLTDATGVVTDRYDYDAFASSVNTSGTTLNTFLYSGEQVDADIPFYYLRARWLSTHSGRFLTVDPVDPVEEVPESTNRYVYVLNRPADFTDPSGRWLTEGHNRILAVVQQALSDYISKTDLAVLEKVSADQDAGWFYVQQAAFNSYQHHMRAVGEDESQALAEYQYFLDLGSLNN